MQIKKLTDIVRHQQDGMPVEVATALLTEPKAKLSNRMRKNARAAREKVYLVTSPIINTTNIDDPATPYPQFTGIEPKSAETRLEERAKKATRSQLVKWQGRCQGRRQSVQEKYVKLCAIVAKNPLHEKKLAKAKLMLALVAQSIDALTDACADELSWRDGKPINGRHAVIDPVIRRRLGMPSIAFGRRVR